MANSVDQDQLWLLNCLSATLDTNQVVRSLAEASLQQATLRPGFGVALCKVSVNKELPVGLRQLAAVLLKQFVKQHWHEDDENFVPLVLPISDKIIVRQHLLLALDDPHVKICTAVGMAVASIALYDWPMDWPDLVPILLKMIGDQSNMNGVRGALRCLCLISSDVDDKLAPTLVAALFPSLYTVISSPHVYDKTLRSKALSIVHSCTSMIGAMSGVYKKETRVLMMPMVKPWMEQFSHILRPPVLSEDPDDWSIRMEVLKCLTQFVQNFPSLTHEEFAVILEPLWQTFTSCLKVYESSAIHGNDDSYSERVDSDGSEQSLEAFAIQLFEFLLTIVGHSKLLDIIGNYVKELVYYTVAYLQMTEEQVSAWLVDANQYVSDEDNATYSCRVSGMLLLEEIISSYGDDGIDALIEGIQKRIAESCLAKASGSVGWWKLQEAAVFALGSLPDPLSEEQVAESAKFQITNIIEQILPTDVGAVLYDQPFLHARVFFTASKLASLITPKSVEQFLSDAIKAITLDVPSPVKVGACQAISKLLPVANQSIIGPHIMSLLSSLIEFLRTASDETLHLVLEALQVTIKAGHGSLASAEPILSPIILDLWAEYVSDPFICVDIVQVLEVIRNAPGCMGPLVSRILPSVAPILENFEHQSEGLVAASLDLLTMLLKNAPIDVVKAVYDACFNHVIQITLRSDDHGQMQNATECLAAFVFGGKQELLSWGGDPGLTMKCLLDVASRLLDPTLESSSSLFVGTYILQLILHLHSQMAQHMRNLVAAVVRRMQSCQSGGLKSSLLLIFAKLVHLSVPYVGQFVDLLAAIPFEGNTNCLTYVMSEWTNHQGEIMGAYSIKVTTTALALLLSTRHAELGNIHVQGHLVKTAGIRTRSKAKLAPDQWIMIPLPAKILALLADMLIEMREHGIDDDDQESDWEDFNEQSGDNREDLIHSMSSINAKPTIEHLNAMAKFLDESDGDDGDDFLKGDDPINEVNLAKYIVDFLNKFFNSDRPLFDHLCQSLSQTQRNAIKMVLTQ